METPTRFLLSRDSLEDAGVACYGISIELPGGDVPLPSGTTSIIKKLENEICDKVKISVLLYSIHTYIKIKINVFLFKSNM